MCPNKDLAKAQKGFMDFGLFRKIIDEAAGFAFDVNLHHRGESLLHPDFFEMVAYAHEAGLVTRFHTNGTLLDEDKARRSIAAGLDQFAFSFDGFDAETYERIRVNADFEKTVGHIVRFLEIKKSLEARKPVTLIELIDQPGLRESADRSRRGVRGAVQGPAPRPDLRQGIPQLGRRTGAAGRRRPIRPARFSGRPWSFFGTATVLPCAQDFFGYYTLGNVRTNLSPRSGTTTEWSPLREKIVRGDIAGLKTCAPCDRLWRPQIFGIPREYLGRALLKKME